MEKLSVVILTFNEERNIARCIASVQPVADEILVVDSFSTDRTHAICEQEGVRFVQHAFAGYIEQKNYAMNLAANDLILSLDADEELSPKLQESVGEVKRSMIYDGYRMNRLTNYCGQWIRHSGWYPDVKMRLVNRTRGTWGGLNPHDRFELIPNGTSAQIEGDILHYSYYTKEEHIAQVHNFAGIAAQALFEKGERSNYLKLLYKPVARFIKSYIINLGFLDGVAGWTIARLTAFSSYLRYRNLIELQRNQK